MALRELSIVLLRVLAIGFVGVGITSIGFNVIQTVSLLGMRIGENHDSFNWYALLWLITPLLEFAVGAVLWFFAPRIAGMMLDYPKHESSGVDAP